MGAGCCRNDKMHGANVQVSGWVVVAGAVAVVVLRVLRYTAVASFQPMQEEMARMCGNVQMGGFLAYTGVGMALWWMWH